MTYFQRQGWSVATNTVATNYLAGDVVAWDLGSGVTHIGIVSDKRTTKGTPLIIHNIGSGAQEENILFQYQIIGHYRPRFATSERK
jgi:uncharacterized protein YijF (DUF1287 family)